MNIEHTIIFVEYFMCRLIQGLLPKYACNTQFSCAFIYKYNLNYIFSLQFITIGLLIIIVNLLFKIIFIHNCII